jgi:hypothetical protein
MRILFLFIGESHHVFHALPIAAELSALSPETEIEVAFSDDGAERLIRQVMVVYPYFKPLLRKLKKPIIQALLKKLGLENSSARLLTLLKNIPYFREFDAIVVPERTSTIVRHFLKGNTRLIFTPHGAGDRAIMLDPRDAHFHFVLVAGEKSEKRLLQKGTIRPGHYAVNGYVKLDFIEKVAITRPSIFKNNRPTVLYAPHFRPNLSSWSRCGGNVIDAFAAQDRYNLIVAPHIRLFHGIDEQVRKSIESRSVPDKILIDLGSERLVDMSYTAGADIYLGDVSSQVYEFLWKPRPCVFLNAHGVNWQEDPNYLFWKMGEVVRDADEIVDAIDRAIDQHSHYLEHQKALLAISVGSNPSGAASRGAEAISAFLAPRV